jgi:hypothetical protein
LEAIIGRWELVCFPKHSKVCVQWSWLHGEKTIFGKDGVSILIVAGNNPAGVREEGHGLLPARILEMELDPNQLVHQRLLYLLI